MQLNSLGSVRCGDYYVKFDAAQFAVLLAYEGVLLRGAAMSTGDFGEMAKELLEKADVRVGGKITEALKEEKAMQSY